MLDRAALRRVYWQYRADPARAVRDLGLCALPGRTNIGRCAICEGRTLFVQRGPWLRDQYRCAGCDSIPRQRALMLVLEAACPGHRGMVVHESSPAGPASEKLRRVCRDYTASQFFPDTPRGSYRDGTRCEDLEALTFATESVDVFITQDVLEHVLRPARAFAEIGRVLRPGGAHVFTVPCHRGRASVTRALVTPAGMTHRLPPAFHENPVDPRGSLVVTDWGEDLPEAVWEASGLFTTMYRLRDRRLGLDGAFLEVFVSRKRGRPSD